MNLFETFYKIILVTILANFPAYTIAQESCVTVLECAQKALEEAQRSKKLVEEMSQLKDEITQLVEQQSTLIVSGSIETMDATKEIALELTRPGLLIATVTSYNTEGKQKKGQHTINASTSITIDGTRCAADLSAYFVFSGSGVSNSSCVYFLDKGTHKLKFLATSTYSATTRRNANYYVLPFKPMQQ